MMPNLEPIDITRPLRTLDESQLRSLDKLKALIAKRVKVVK